MSSSMPASSNTRSIQSNTQSATRQVAFRSTDPAEIERICAEELGATLRLLGSDNPDGYYFSLGHTDAGRISLDDLSSGGLTGRMEPERALLVVTGQRGLITRDVGGSEEHVGPGDTALLARPGEVHRFRWAGDEPFARSVRIDLDLLEEVAAATTGVANVRFTSSQPIDREAARQWQQTVEHVRRTLVGRPGAPVSSLVIGEASRFLAAVALSTFPNTTMDPGPAAAQLPPARDLPITAETVRDAVSFIEERAHDDLSVADIAAAAGVTPRAIQLAFRRHLETTPMGYLRQVRLGRVHEELRLAGPHDGVTVTEVAGRWGFSGTSRFTSYYREAFGVAPSQTLAS
jgi:AraC-like DNA-binding protein